MADETNTPTAVVTGGSAGIGAAICRRLLEAGYETISLARRAPGFEHPRLHGFEVDLADPEATREAAGEVANRFEVTSLVHNAGVIRAALLEEVALTDLQYVVDLHLSAAITLAQAFVPAMKAAGFGRIVNISSRAALGLETRSVYSATKAGLIGLTRTWALELGPSGITANVVAPGPITTDMFYDVIPAGSPQETALAGKIPVRRLGTADDVAEATLFFLSPRSGFITGQTLFVCGGSSVSSLSL